MVTDMTQNNQRLWIAFTLVCFVSVREVAVTYGVSEETKCYAAATDLEPNCGFSSGLVISIDWNATFFGQSQCVDPNRRNCCPDDTDCRVLVRDTDHFEGVHWDKLNACNGQTACSVQVQFTAHGCPPKTDYETVTYRCVTPGEKDTTSWTSSYKTASTQSTSLHSDPADSSPSVTSSRWSTTAPHSEETGAGDKTSATYSTQEPSDGDNLGIIIGVCVGVLLLVILILIAIAMVYYRRKKRASKPTDVQYRDSIKRPREPDDVDKTYSHISRQSLSDKNTYEAVNYRVSSASDLNKHSDDRKPEPPPSRSPSKGHNSQPLNGLSEGPSDAVYAEPLDVKSDKEDTITPSSKSDTDYSYTYFKKQPHMQARSEGTDCTGCREKSVVYADILHAQNEEYADDDSNHMEIEDNDLYSVTENNSDSRTEEIPAVQPVEDGDDDMEIMDNDVYNLSDTSEDEVSQSANHQTEDDDDMVVTENDVYNVRLPGDDTEADSE